MRSQGFGAHRISVIAWFHPSATDRKSYTAHAPAAKQPITKQSAKVLIA